MTIATFLTYSLPEGQEAIKRIAAKLNGLQSHFHPELFGVFFRNVLWADKMLFLSEKIQNEKGRKAKIAFKVGSGHAGVEDFLLAGRNFCRFMITHFPDDFIKQTLARCGGVENFSSIKLLDLSPDLAYLDLEDHKRRKQAEDKSIEETIYDEDLMRDLVRNYNLSPHPPQKQ